MTPAGPHAVTYRELKAVELADARLEVVEWAADLYEDQLATWERKKRLNRRNKARPPTVRECRDKSREIRIKRERDTTYWNDLVSPHPQY